MLPIVYILATGGTIAGQAGTAVRPSEYEPSQLTGNDLVRAVPELEKIAEIRAIQICNVAGPNIGFREWKTLAETANNLLNSDEENVAGIVVTHGTATLEETAYFLNLTVRSKKPIVMVGAQRPAGAMSADGAYNLYTAVRVAIDPDAAGKGVLVALNEEINGARDVRKSNTFRLEAFNSGELGFLGYIDTDKVQFYQAPRHRHTFDSEFDIFGIAELPQVDIVESYIEASGVPIIALANAGAKGVVLVGTGGGHLSPDQYGAIERLHNEGKDMVFIRSNSAGNGRVLPFAPADRLDILCADNLLPKKARILLQLALTRSSDLEQVRRMFAEY